MAVSIGSNISSLNAQRRLAENSQHLSQVFERLSSGQRINSASDDAAGLSIADSLRTDTRIYTQGIRNANDGISALAIAQSTLQDLVGIVTRQKELAEQAANGVYSLQQRKALHTEANSLVDEFNRIVQVSSFNGQKVLNGDSSNLRIQLGTGTNGSVLVGIGDSFQRNSGTGQFTYSSSYTAASTATSTETVDLNNDGILDIVAGSTGGTRGLRILMGNADGTFQAPVTYGTSNWFGDISIGDLNGDGALDVINSTEAGAAIYVWMGNGNGSFRDAVSYVATSSRRGGAIGDINGDGIADYVAGDPSGNTVNAFLGNGDGTFQAVTSLVLSGSTLNDIKIADFDNDGRNEILVSSGAGGVVSMLSTSSNGTLQLRSTISNLTGADDIVVNDFNGDGYLDFGVLSDVTDTIDIVIGNGDGNFKARVSYNPGVSIDTRLRGADLNGDGISDLVAKVSGGGVVTYFGNGDGTFRYGATSSGTNGNFTLGDFNRDGAVDLAGYESDGDMAILFANTTHDSSEGRLYLLSRSGALSALNETTQTLNRITSELGKIGANQARLGVAINKLLVERENYQAAESQIRDTDIAQDSAESIRLSTIQKIGAAILAQANLQPNLALQLLGR